MCIRLLRGSVVQKFSSAHGFPITLSIARHESFARSNHPVTVKKTSLSSDMCAVSWSSKLQANVSLSTIESVLCSVCGCSGRKVVSDRDDQVDRPNSTLKTIKNPLS